MIVKTRDIKEGILKLFWIICIMFNASYAYVLVDDYLQLGSLFIVAVFSFVVLGIGRKLLINTKFFLHPWIVLSALIISSMLFNGELQYWGTYIHQVLVLAVAVLFTLSYSVESFTRILAKVMCVCVIISVILWICMNVLNIVLPLPTIDTGFETLYNAIICFASINNPGRIMGPFWEPGIFASILCITLLFVYFFDAFENKKCVTIILVIGIIFTFSTAGYLLLSIIFAIGIINIGKGKEATILSLLFVLVFYVILIYQDNIITYLASIYPTMFSKMTFRSNSMMTRIMGPAIDLEIFANNPVFGSGMKRYNDQWPNVAQYYSNVVARTSTITFFLANFGFGGLLYVYTLIKGVFQQKRINMLSRVLVFLFFIAVLSKEPNYFNLLTCICILYLYTNIVKGVIYEREI